MKILQLTKKLPIPPHDGESIAILQLTESFLKARHEVIMLCLNTNKHFQKIPKNLNFKLIALNINTNINPIQLLISDFFTSQPYIAKRFLSKAYLNTIKEILSTEKPDIIQAEGLYTAQYFYYFQNSNIPKIFRAHNIEAQIWKRRTLRDKNILKKLYSKLISYKLTKYEISIIQISDAIVSISTNDFDYLKQKSLNTPIINIPSSFPSPKKHLRFSKFQDIVFLASLDWYPNIEGLFWFLKKVWPLILSKQPNTELHIAGRNPSKKIAKQINQFKNTHFYGEIKEVNKFLARGKILIAPLFVGSGMRIKIIEAMSLGIPIVATSIAVEGIPVNHNKNILVTDNELNFANYCTNLIKNDILWTKIASNGQKFIQNNYQQENITKSLLNFYTKNFL